MIAGALCFISLYTIFFDVFGMVIFTIVTSFYPVAIATIRMVFMTQFIILATAVFVCFLSWLVVSSQD